MADAVKCPDDPAAILKQRFCLSGLSKNLRGRLKLAEKDEQRCEEPACRTLKTVHVLKVDVRANRPCDSRLGQALSGTLVVERLVSAFDTDGMHRGFHAGDFLWTGSGVKVAGRMSGMTNVGTHREPAFRACQRCDERGVMEGRLCGEVVSTENRALRGCQVVGAYRIRFDPGVGGGEGEVAGTFEGDLICPCR